MYEQKGTSNHLRHKKELFFVGVLKIYATKISARFQELSSKIPFPKLRTRR